MLFLVSPGLSHGQTAVEICPGLALAGLFFLCVSAILWGLSAARKTVASRYYVRRAARGSRTETHGPFGNLYLAIAKGCELLKAYPTAATSIDDGADILIFDEESLREKCQSK
jgi:hypothetical protein